MVIFMQYTFPVEIFDQQEFSVMFKIAKTNQKRIFYSKTCILKNSPHLDSRKQLECMKIWFDYSGTGFFMGHVWPRSDTMWSDVTVLLHSLGSWWARSAVFLLSPLSSFLLCCQVSPFGLPSCEVGIKSLVYKNSRNDTLRANYVLAPLGSSEYRKTVQI